jgi:hypothetical protein
MGEYGDQHPYVMRVSAENEALKAKVKELEEKLASEIKWYAERLLGEASETSGQVRAYRDVIKILTDKDRDSCGCH